VVGFLLLSKKRKKKKREESADKSTFGMVCMLLLCAFSPSVIALHLA
jgi:hypothetical protein